MFIPKVGPRFLLRDLHLWIGAFRPFIGRALYVFWNSRKEGRKEMLSWNSRPSVVHVKEMEIYTATIPFDSLLSY